MAYNQKYWADRVASGASQSEIAAEQKEAAKTTGSAYSGHASTTSNKDYSSANVSSKGLVSSDGSAVVSGSGNAVGTKNNTPAKKYYDAFGNEYTTKAAANKADAKAEADAKAAADKLAADKAAKAAADKAAKAAKAAADKAAADKAAADKAAADKAAAEKYYDAFGNEYATKGAATQADIKAEADAKAAADKLAADKAAADKAAADKAAADKAAADKLLTRRNLSSTSVPNGPMFVRKEGGGSSTQSTPESRSPYGGRSFWDRLSDVTPKAVYEPVASKKYYDAFGNEYATQADADQADVKAETAASNIRDGSTDDYATVKAGTGLVSTVMAEEEEQAPELTVEERIQKMKDTQLPSDSAISYGESQSVLENGLSGLDDVQPWDKWDAGNGLVGSAIDQADKEASGGIDSGQGTVNAAPAAEKYYDAFGNEYATQSDANQADVKAEADAYPPTSEGAPTGQEIVNGVPVDELSSKYIDIMKFSNNLGFENLQTAQTYWDNMSPEAQAIFKSKENPELSDKILAGVFGALIPGFGLLNQFMYNDDMTLEEKLEYANKTAATVARNDENSGANQGVADNNGGGSTGGTDSGDSPAPVADEDKNAVQYSNLDSYLTLFNNYKF